MRAWSLQNSSYLPSRKRQFVGPNWQAVRSVVVPSCARRTPLPRTMCPAGTPMPSSSNIRMLQASGKLLSLEKPFLNLSLETVRNNHPCEPRTIPRPRGPHSTLLTSLWSPEFESYMYFWFVEHQPRQETEPQWNKEMMLCFNFPVTRKQEKQRC